MSGSGNEVADNAFVGLLRTFYSENIGLLEEDPGDFPPVQIMELTSSSYINHFFSLTLALCTNQLDKSLYKRFFMRELSRFYNFFGRFNEMYNPEGMPEDLAHHAGLVLNSFIGYEEALSFIAGYLDTNDIAHISTALTKGTLAINVMSRTWQLFVRRDLASLAKSCDSCQEPMSVSDLKCPVCGADVTFSPEELELELAALRLRIQELSMESHSPFPLCVIEVYDGYYAYMNEKLPLGRFIETLDWVLTQYEMAKNDFEQKVLIEFDDFVLERLYLILESTKKVIGILDKIRNLSLYFNEKSVPKFWPPLVVNLKLIYKGYEEELSEVEDYVSLQKQEQTEELQTGESEVNE